MVSFMIPDYIESARYLVHQFSQYSSVGNRKSAATAALTGRIVCIPDMCPKID